MGEKEKNYFLWSFYEIVFYRHVFFQYNGYFPMNENMSIYSPITNVHFNNLLMNRVTA